MDLAQKNNNNKKNDLQFHSIFSSFQRNLFKSRIQSRKEWKTTAVSILVATFVKLAVTSCTRQE